MLAASFPPFDLDLLALVAPIPLLWAWRGATPRRAALYGFVFGLAFFGLLLEWSRYFGAVAIAPLVIAEAAYLAAAGALVAGFERRGMRSPALVAAVWVVVETVRGRWPLGGLPWGELGVALHDFDWARALASFGGVALVSFLIICFDELLLDGFFALRARRTRAARRPVRRRACGPGCARSRSCWPGSSSSWRWPTGSATSPPSRATSGSRSCRATTRTAT